MRNDLAIRQHINVFRQTHDSVHHVFNEQNGDTRIANAANEVDDFNNFLGVQTRHHLVEQ